MFYLDRDVTWDYHLLWLQVVATGGQVNGAERKHPVHLWSALSPPLVAPPPLSPPPLNTETPRLFTGQT